MNTDSVIIHLLTADEPGVFLTADEVGRAASFRFPHDAERWRSWRSGLRRVLGETIGVHPLEVPLVIGEFGKPVLAAPFDGLHFSLSHCNDLALVALCEAGPVGIDLEPLARASDLFGCEESFCHPAEILHLPAGNSARGLQLLEIWTAKESLLKALGTGLSHPPETVRIQRRASGFTATSDSILPGIGMLAIHRPCHPMLTDYCTALSVCSAVSRLEIILPGGSTSNRSPVITSLLPVKSDG